MENNVYLVLFYAVMAAGVIMLLCRSRSPLSVLTTHFDPGNKAVKERIESILDTTRKHQGWWIVVLVLLLCLFSGGLWGREQNDTHDPHSETVPESQPEITVEWTDPVSPEKGRWYTVPEMPPESAETDGTQPVWRIGGSAEPACPMEITGFCHANIYDGKYGNASASWLRLQITAADKSAETYLYVPGAMGEETEPIRLIRENETVYSLYLSVPRGRMYYFRYTITASDEGYTVGAPLQMEYRTLAEVGAVDTALYTACTLEEIRQYTDAGVWTPQVYRFLLDLLSGESEIPEYNTVRITDSRLTFTIPLTDYSIWWDFTVAESGLETLPPGEYHKEIRDIADCCLADPLPTLTVSAETIQGDTESRMIVSFISSSLIWNTPAYGEGTNYPGMHNYLCEYYGNGKLSLADYIRLAKEKFGADMQAEEIPMVYEENGIQMVASGGLGGSPRYHVTETEQEGTMSHVTVQFYADCNGLLPAGKVQYHITKEGVFHGYDIVEPFRYEPYALRYWPDEAS